MGGVSAGGRPERRWRGGACAAPVEAEVLAGGVHRGASTWNWLGRRGMRRSGAGADGGARSRRRRASAGSGWTWWCFGSCRLARECWRAASVYPSQGKENGLLARREEEWGGLEPVGTSVEKEPEALNAPSFVSLQGREESSRGQVPGGERASGDVRGPRGASEGRATLGESGGGGAIGRAPTGCGKGEG